VSDNRSAIDFAAMVAVEFLEVVQRFAMEVVESGSTRVVFSAHDIFLVVYWGRGSFEVGAGVGTWESSNDHTTGDREIPVAFLFDHFVSGDTTIRPPWVASSVEGVRVALRQLAIESRAVLEKAWTEDEGLSDAYRQWHAYIKVSSDEFLAARPRRMADAAWHARDYAAVVREYESILERYTHAKLSPSELAKLRYASSHQNVT
jgi:hypothetical protein